MIGIPSASRNILCSSAYATEVGARSWLKSGEGMRMLAKCAAWPASCISVVSPVSPEPTAHRHRAAQARERRAGAESERIGSSGARDARRGGLAAGSARLVKCVTVGCQLPSALTHAGCGLRAAAGGAGVGRCAQPADGRARPPLRGRWWGRGRGRGRASGRSRWSTCPCGRAGRGSSRRPRTRCRARRRSGPTARHSSRRESTGRASWSRRRCAEARMHPSA